MDQRSMIMLSEGCIIKCIISITRVLQPCNWSIVVCCNSALTGSPAHPCTGTVSSKQIVIKHLSPDRSLARADRDEGRQKAGSWINVWGVGSDMTSHNAPGLRYHQVSKISFALWENSTFLTFKWGCIPHQSLILWWMVSKSEMQTQGSSNSFVDFQLFFGILEYFLQEKIFSSEHWRKDDFKTILDFMIITFPLAPSWGEWLWLQLNYTTSTRKSPFALIISNYTHLSYPFLFYLILNWIINWHKRPECFTDLWFVLSLNCCVMTGLMGVIFGMTLICASGAA